MMGVPRLDWRVELASAAAGPVARHHVIDASDGEARLYAQDECLASPRGWFCVGTLGHGGFSAVSAGSSRHAGVLSICRHLGVNDVLALDS